MRPAEPNSTAHRLQAKAAKVPNVTSVSIVSAPWRAFANVARWNGQPAQNTTGAVKTSDTHCQPGNCHAGTMPSATTGAASTMPQISRVRRVVCPGMSSTSCWWPGAS
ncbi:MAG: hypothetical protein K0S70_2195 [Microbacterium sp.]|nr:hypothetical protein [Microbacterium sp.]